MADPNASEKGNRGRSKRSRSLQSRRDQLVEAVNDGDRFMARLESRAGRAEAAFNNLIWGLLFQFIMLSIALYFLHPYFENLNIRYIPNNIWEKQYLKMISYISKIYNQK